MFNVIYEISTKVNDALIQVSHRTRHLLLQAGFH